MTHPYYVSYTCLKGGVTGKTQDARLGEQNVQRKRVCASCDVATFRTCDTVSDVQANHTFTPTFVQFQLFVDKPP